MDWIRQVGIGGHMTGIRKEGIWANSQMVLIYRMRKLRERGKRHVM